MLDMEGEITVEPILDFIGKLRFKPFMGSKIIAIINNAKNLNLQSGNALLKTLEEPSPSSIIILVSSSGSVLPTVVSRCQVLNFSAFSFFSSKRRHTKSLCDWSSDVCSSD